jgi:hypothetical protein
LNQAATAASIGGAAPFWRVLRPCHPRCGGPQVCRIRCPAMSWGGTLPSSPPVQIRRKNKDFSRQKNSRRLSAEIFMVAEAGFEPTTFGL